MTVCIQCKASFARVDSTHRFYCSDLCYAAAGDGYNRTAVTIVERTLEAFEAACHELGATGFQASWALTQVLWQGNGWEGPGTIIRAENMLYPQYERPTRQAQNFEASEEVREWLREQARAQLAKHGLWRDGAPVAGEPTGLLAPFVLEHWRKLAEGPEPNLFEEPT